MDQYEVDRFTSIMNDKKKDAESTCLAQSGVVNTPAPSQTTGASTITSVCAIVN